MHRRKPPRTPVQVYRDDVEHTTGFKMELIQEYAALVGQSTNAVMAALMMVHCNSRDEEVRIMMHRFTGDDRSTRPIMQEAYEVLEAGIHINLSDPFSRFDRRDMNWPDTTCLVDGVPCFMRGNKLYYNGKHHDKMMSWQVFVGLRRQPLWFMGPYVGSMHDSKAFGGGLDEDDARDSKACFGDLVQTQPFPHTKQELFNSDKAYIANSHCLCEFKKKADTVKEGIRDLSANEELFNEHFKALRALTIAKMWILMWNLECLKEKRNPGDLYASDLIKANAITERHFTTVCTCGFSGTAESVPRSVQLKAKKHILKRCGGKYPITKNSAHRKKGTPATKDPAEQQAKRDRHKEKKLVGRVKRLSARQKIAAAENEGEGEEAEGEERACEGEDEPPKKKARKASPKAAKAAKARVRVRVGTCKKQGGQRGKTSAQKHN